MTQTGRTTPVSSPRRALVRPPGTGCFDEEITHADAHFVVAHFAEPFPIPSHDWTLQVVAQGGRFVHFTVPELDTLSTVTRAITLTCAGNPLASPRPLRRAATARWSGPLLRDVLEAADVDVHAQYIVLRGADAGCYGSKTTAQYEKYIGLDEVLRSGAFLALRMNGEDLPTEHGGPVRIVIPGYYGTNWVKWLTQISFANDPPIGRFMSELYVDQTTLRPIWGVDITSQIARPSRGQEVRLGQPTIVWGWAWGLYPVQAVDISPDGGISWLSAEVQPTVDSGQWQRFAVNWRPRLPGTSRLLSRAHDMSGQSQPNETAINRIAGHPVVVS